MGVSFCVYLICKPFKEPARVLTAKSFYSLAVLDVDHVDLSVPKIFPILRVELNKVSYFLGRDFGWSFYVTDKEKLDFFFFLFLFNLLPLKGHQLGSFRLKLLLNLLSLLLQKLPLLSFKMLYFFFEPPFFFLKLLHLLLN